MKIDEEATKEVYYNFKIDMTDDERANLLIAAKREIPKEVLENLILEWFSVKLIKEATEVAIEEHKATEE